MAYPLNLPSSPGPKKVSCFQETKAGVARSPYTGKTQVYDWGVDLFHLHLEFPKIKRENAGPWVNFLREMRGQVGTFYYDVVEVLPDGSTTTGETTLRVFRFKESISNWDVNDENEYMIVIDAIEDPQ